jgi:hypothetical protein
MNATITREQWLSTAIEELRPVFQALGRPLPQAIRVACGFPLNAKRSKAIGECWASTSSADKTIEILISPTIADPFAVFEVLVHEACHSTLNPWFNHGINFQKIAGQMLLEPCHPSKEAWKSTRGTAEFKTAYASMVADLGDYPHAELTYRETKTQGTRMLKAVCAECGYTVRMTAKWAALGAPICPVDTIDLTLA